MSTDESVTEDNQEWQLAELVDAIASEIDHAADTLSLKSYARGKSLAIKQLNLDLEVTVRRGQDGEIWFRTVVDPKENGATVLKLDFTQVLQSQLDGLRKPLDRPVDNRPLATLPDITDAEIKQLNAIAIYSVDDLERYTQTPAMIAEVSRKTDIPDPRIRMWRQLPFLTEVKPAKSPPGSSVVIEGGNFGSVPSPDALVLFQGQPAKIITWSESRLSVIMPQVRGVGVLFAVIDGQTTNTLPWEATTIDLLVRDITLNPPLPVAGDLITLEADLINQGSSPTGSFQVEWTINNLSDLSPHGTLQPNQRSQDSSIRHQLRFKAGFHIIRFTADPQQQLPDINPSKSTFTKKIWVKSRQELTIADFRPIKTLDPLLNPTLGPADVLSLVFRGLCRFNSLRGLLVPDLAVKWKLETVDKITKILYFQLHDNLRFHDGTPLTVADVEFTYQVLRKIDSPWRKLVLTSIRDIKVVDQKTIAFTLQSAPQRLPSQSHRLREIDSIEPVTKPPIDPQLLTVGIVPRHGYGTERFGIKPIGTGPFQVETFDPSGIKLSAFPDYWQGTPRLDQIVIPVICDHKQLLDMVLGHKVTAAVVPYSQDLAQTLRENKEWTVVPLTQSQPQLLQVQSTRIQERMPNPFNTNWNAHLWYSTSESGEVQSYGLEGVGSRE
ncbi:ABC transporter substrate-binding protein [Moorena producens]|uniref:ABC transporter substrate-binding protein n=1 Tax=Moorena producens TaxID=1155739 RepID=UPI003C732601